MQYIELILSLASTALGLVITTLTFFLKYIKNAKAKKIAEQTVKICDAILPYIKKAETFVNYSGEEKKEYVMTKVNRYAQENKLQFDETFISQKIEELITLTKEVNITTKNSSTGVKITFPVKQQQDEI